MKIIVYLMVFLTAISCKIKNDDPQKEQELFYVENYKRKLDSLVPVLISAYQTPIVGVGIIEKGKIEYLQVYGEHQKGEKAQKNTLFNIASITKPIVATAILKLVENRDWNLDEPLHHYHTDPDVANDNFSKLVTTRHCLSHTTGFKNWRWNEENGKLKFNFKPGSKFQYSGEGMEYLRHAIEKKFGMGLDKIVDSLVFKPLGMEDATMRWIHDKDTIRFAKWYNSTGELHSMDYKIDKVNAADDMVLTVKDLAVFGNAIVNGKLLTDSTYVQMIKPQSSINKKLDQGLGWVLYDQFNTDELILNHDGGDPGVVATMILLPQRKNGIVIFVNSDNGSNIVSAILDEVVINGREIIGGLSWDNEIPEKIQIKEELLQKYVGTYETNRGFSITFKALKGALLTESTIFPKLKLHPKSNNEFFPLPFELYFRFIEENNTMTFQLLKSDKSIDLIGEKKILP